MVKSVRSGGWWGGRRSGQSQKSIEVNKSPPLESVVPDVIDSPVVHSPTAGEEFEASPPILREDISSDMKIIHTTDAQYPQLNGFGTFLGLSDRLMQTEAPFFLILPRHDAHHLGRTPRHLHFQLYARQGN